VIDGELFMGMRKSKSNFGLTERKGKNLYEKFIISRVDREEEEPILYECNQKFNQVKRRVGGPRFLAVLFSGCEGLGKLYNELAVTMEQHFILWLLMEPRMNNNHPKVCHRLFGGLGREPFSSRAVVLEEFQCCASWPTSVT